MNGKTAPTPTSTPAAKRSYGTYIAVVGTLVVLGGAIAGSIWALEERYARIQAVAQDIADTKRAAQEDSNSVRRDLLHQIIDTQMTYYTNELEKLDNKVDFGGTLTSSEKTQHRLFMKAFDDLAARKDKLLNGSR